MWFTLPIELQRQCLQAVDVPTLKSFRLANKSVSTLATEILFSIVNLKSNRTSADNFNNIVENDALRLLVRTVIINTSDDPNIVEYSSGEADPDPWLKKSLKKIPQFQTLREVRLIFSRWCAGENTESWGPEIVEGLHFRTEVLWRTFKPLARVIREGGLKYFDTLTLRNLQNYVDDDIYYSEDFATVLGKVKKLHLCIATESDEVINGNGDRRSPRQMFQYDLVPRWLSPVSAQLTHLTLYATDIFWGFLPFCDLREIYFPRLQSLSLGYYTIVHDWQIDWILSHAATLEELLLDGCAIVSAANLDASQVISHWPDLKPYLKDPETDEDSYLKEVDLRWHQILPRFQTELPRLHHFAIGRGDRENPRMFEQRYDLVPHMIWDRYFIFDYVDYLSPWMTSGMDWFLSNPRTTEPKHLYKHGDVKGYPTLCFPACYIEDRDALAALLEVTKRRAQEKADL
ncbi:hypothetical protein DM02DRAFT_615130 [Periconia macrospinosa]|uniref:F-box domain-containing protein n=1 Tax=Periconia macrospinosa TaxID=97972 RepID=A0A2V1DMM7_9PLEO|nr:hypothetical protein DM02DRAFT_615130 [Periconia macrospinosa]